MVDPAAYTQAQQGIDSSAQQLMQQLAQLRSQAEQQNSLYTRNLTGAGAEANVGYNSGVDGLMRDLSAQGISNPNAVSTQIATNAQQLAQTQQRQQDYINALTNNETSGINADYANVMRGADASHQALAANYGQAVLADDGSGGGGGGGGGGYSRRGYGSGGGSDYLTAGDAGLESELAAEPYNDTPVTSGAQRQVGNRPLDTLLGDYLYGTHGKGDEFVKGGFGHVGTFGNNAVSLASKYARYAKAKFGKTWTDQQGNQHKAVDKKTMGAFLKNLSAEQSKVQRNHEADHKVKVKQKQGHVKAQLRGLE